MCARTSLWAAVLAGALSTGVGAAQGPTRIQDPRRDSGNVRKTTYYIVVQAKDMKGEITFEVIAEEDLAKRTKDAASEYKEALAAWVLARKEALKKKEKFTEEKPVEPYVKRVGSHYKTQEAAQAVADKLRQRAEEAKQKDKAAK